MSSTRKLQVIGAHLKGKDGYTPQRGVDYWTEEDKKEITDYVDKEISEFDFVKVVEELPEVGLVNREYFVRKANPDTNDLFDEWAWVNKGTEENPEYGWEFKGTKKFEVELTDYVKFTDKASDQKAGVIKTSAYYGTLMEGDVLSINQASDWAIKNRKTYNNASFLTVKKLDHALKVGLTTNTETLTDEEKQAALSWLGAVGFNDYATNDNTKAGVVKVHAGGYYGVDIDSDTHVLQIYPTTAFLIEYRHDAQFNRHKSPITPQQLDDAIIFGLTTNQKTMTDEQQGKACDWLGALKKDTSVPTNKSALARVYGIDKDGNQVILDCVSEVSRSLGTKANTIAMRDGDGNFEVALLPYFDNHAASKRFVEYYMVSFLNDTDKAHWRTHLSLYSKEEVDGKLAELEESIESAGSNYTQVKDDISGLQNDYGGIKERINDLQGQIDKVNVTKLYAHSVQGNEEIQIISLEPTISNISAFIDLLCTRPTSVVSANIYFAGTGHGILSAEKTGETTATVDCVYMGAIERHEIDFEGLTITTVEL